MAVEFRGREQEVEALPKERAQPLLTALDHLLRFMKLAKVHQEHTSALDEGGVLNELIKVNMTARPRHRHRLDVVEEGALQD